MKTILALILVLGVVLAACSSSDNTGTSNTAGEDKTAAKADKDAGSSASAEFLKLVGAPTLEWKVSYDLTSNYGGQSQKLQMTQYMKTEKKIRFDMTVADIASQIYNVNNVYTVCSKQDAAWRCYKYSAPQENQYDTQKVEQEIKDKPSDYDIQNDGTKQVAGVTASCFKVVGIAEGMTTRYCFKNGVPLYISTQTKEGSMEMIATSYSESVADSAFVPPAVAQDMSALTGGAGAGSAGNAGSTAPAGGNSCSYCNYLSGEQKTQCLASC